MMAGRAQVSPMITERGNSMITRACAPSLPEPPRTPYAAYLRELLGASVAFSQMLLFGRRYLLARKQAVMELEEFMAWHGGQRIVAREVGESGNGWLKSSPTGLIMVLLPILVALCWLAILSVLIAV